MNTEPGLARFFFCLHDFRPGPVIVAVIPLQKVAPHSQFEPKLKFMRFRPNHSYINILLTYLVIVLGSMVVGVIWHLQFAVLVVFATLPLLFAFLLFTQLRSGIALDSWWTARYPRGTWQYTGLIAWNALGLLVAITILLTAFFYPKHLLW